MLFLYLLLQNLLSNVFKEPSIWFVILVAGLRIISPLPRGIPNKYAPLLQACCSVFPKNLLKDLLNRAGKVPVVLICDIYNVYKIVADHWLYLQY